MIFGRITEVTVEQLSHDDDSTPLGLAIRAMVEGDKVPYTQILPLDGTAVEQFRRSFSYPVRDIKDFIGLEVRIEDRVLIGTGAGRHYPQDVRAKILDEFKNGIKDVRGRRFYICQLVGQLRDIIENIDTLDAKEKNELCNLANVLLRMMIYKNDGGGSDQRLQAF